MLPVEPILTSSTLPPLVPCVLMLAMEMLPTVGVVEVFPEITVTEPPVELLELASIAAVDTDTGAPI